MPKHAMVVGAGLTGATAAAELHRAGWNVTVYEAEDTPGGNLRTGKLGGITYERFGPHIWHTSNKKLHDRVLPYLRPYTHKVKTLTRLGLLSWPPQIGELRELEEWPGIEEELEKRPELPNANTASFEEYSIALMGRTLYETFIKEYTEKQWGRPATELSAAFAPKRIDLRVDGDTRLFRDQPQGWFEGERYIADCLAEVSVTLGIRVRLKDIAGADAYVITAALDDFLFGDRVLDWRGVGFVHEYFPDREFMYETSVTNFPSRHLLYTRATEPKHMTGDKSNGTVVSWEYSGTDDRFYPVLDQGGVNKMRQLGMMDELHRQLPTAVVAGRLGNYVYIDMDQAIQQGINAARKVMGVDDGGL